MGTSSRIHEYWHNDSNDIVLHIPKNKTIQLLMLKLNVFHDLY